MSFNTPIRNASFSSTGINMPTSSLKSQSGAGTPPSVKRVPSTPMSMSNASILTNKQANSEESLYYICLRLMASLAKVPGMEPFIELAYQQADEAAEQQALAISSISDSPDSASASIGSSTDLNSGKHPLYSWNKSLHTFATGLLPAQISYDPVTPIAMLFRQGAPLCVILNALSPENPIDIVSSDDMKVCKTSIYQFMTACKLNLNIRDDELFPITTVFSDNTTHLIKIINSVNFVLHLEPSFISPPIPDQIQITDSRSKIIKEMIETERKYVQALELLVEYRNDVVESERISNEDINILFPNLNEIVDFQRKFLIGLECNAIVPAKYQRIGSVFLHVGIEGFRIFEKWALYQTDALKIIHREAQKLRNVSKVINDPYELQNFFLIKPIQRLTKYPLLLSQLLKESDQSWPNYNELHQAYIVSKEVALSINEAQRRSENVQHLEELNAKVVDWKGYTSRNVGDLLYFNVVTVKDLLTDGHSHEKEVHCYLFEKVIYFFKDVSAKKILGSKKMSNLSFSNNSSNPVQLSLNGIVYINKIYKSSSTDNSTYFAGVPGHYLTLRWKGNKDTGGCIMKFRSEETLQQWNNTIKRLSMEFGADDMMSFHNNTRSLSSISNSSMMTNDTNRSSHTSAASNNRNSDRLRSSSDSNTFMKKLRSTSSSSFNNLNLSYPPLPAEKSLRSLSISSSNAPFTIPKLERNSSAHTSVNNDSELVSNLSNLTLSNPSSVSENMTNIKLIFDKQASSINLSVSSDISYSNLIGLLVQKMNMSSDKSFSASQTTFKFKDEDGDYIRLQGDDDWIIAKEMLEDMDPDYAILELICS